ncbi:MAG TPA: DNA polymerase III subunit beta [Bacteroidales bacterium]|nr:DNA polymerase III subunit beta [Bacteroidales bacterium]
MKFIVSSNTLLKNLQAISGSLGSSSALPILENFLFRLEDNVLYVTASDLETTMTASVPLAMADEDGVVAVPAKILLDTLKTLADIPLTITIDTSSNYMVELSTGEGKYKLAGLSGENYPRAPVMLNANVLEMSSSVLAHAIAKTIIATGNDEMRPVMAGVFCDFTPDDLTFVATDSHRLVRYRRFDTHAQAAVSFIMPKKPLQQLKNLLASEETTVKMEFNQTNAAYSFRNINLICRLIEGRYPNYEAVIPRDNPRKLIVDRTIFLNALRRVSIFANQSTLQVRLRISGQELQLGAEDIDYANEARERLSCSFEGEDIEIGFNSRFLADMLNNVDTEEVMLELSEPNKAGILRPVSPGDETKELLMLVMPVMLNQ